MLSHFYIFLTIFFTVYGQMIIKWQVNLAGTMPIEPTEKVWFLFRLLINPWIITGFLSAFLASLAWIAAMSKFPLSYAYPFMSLAFVSVLVLSPLFFDETVTTPKMIGTSLIILGIIIVSRG